MGNGKLTIVIIDDDPMIGEVLGRFLTKCNYAVTSFTSGQEAVEYLKANPVDLVITDTRMPELNGLEVIKLIREFRPKLHIMVMTSLLDPETVKEMDKEKVCEYLTKPFDLSYLHEVIARQLAASV